jgi:hypothetical protein
MTSKPEGIKHGHAACRALSPWSKTLQHGRQLKQPSEISPIQTRLLVEAFISTDKHGYYGNFESMRSNQVGRLLLAMEATSYCTSQAELM